MPKSLLSPKASGKTFARNNTIPESVLVDTKAEALALRNKWKSQGYIARFRELPGLSKWTVWCVPNPREWITISKGGFTA